jgi:hypothetical protein
VKGTDATLPKFLTPESAKIGAQNSLLRRYVGGEKGPLPEEISEIAVRELFKAVQVTEIAALLADRRRVDPESESLKALLRELRRKPSVRSQIANEKLAALGRLFDAQPMKDLGARRSLVRAKRLSELYFTYYHHAVPFDREVLRAVWGGCSARGCKTAQRQAEKQLGKIETPTRRRDPQRRAGAGSPISNEDAGSTDRSHSPASD